jgi:glucose/arabinose dehydrogenase
MATMAKMQRWGHRGSDRGARAIVLGVALLCVVLAGCGDDDDEASEGSTPQTTTTTTAPTGGEDPTTTTSAIDAGPTVTSVIAASLQEPIALVVNPDDPGHLWVAERSGRVKRMTVEDGGETLTSSGAPVLDLTDQTTTEAERGLLDLAFAPEGGTLYVSFTDEDGNSRVVAYPVDGAEVDEAGARPRSEIDQPYPNHNGGHLVIGPDGDLWFGLGDGGSADDPENRAQDPSTDLGKIIRIDPETGDSEIVVSGVRNPWRFAFGPSGSLWVADVGQGALEEVTFLPAGEIEGANLGWSGYEGSEPYLDGDGRRPAEHTPPVFEYSHDEGNCSITGGFEYQGTAIEGLPGAFLFADYCAGRIRAVRVGPEGDFATEYDLGIEVAAPISFGQDDAGEPYVLSADGDIVRIIPG